MTPKERLIKAEVRADRAEERAERAQNRADRAEARADLLREQLNTLQSELRIEEATDVPKQADVIEELHFKTGLLGLLGRCFLRLRAAGDPLEQTLVLPPLIWLIFVRLNELGQVGISVAYPVLLLPASIAGIWLGASLGVAALFRIALRGVLVGAIEGAGYVALTSETLDKPHALRAIVQLIFINFFLYGFWGMLGGTIQSVAMASQAQWRASAARRAVMFKVLRISLFTQKLEGEGLLIAFAVLFVRSVAPILMLMWIANTFFGVSPGDFIRGHFFHVSISTGENH
jgi:hypothetical protein